MTPDDPREAVIVLDLLAADAGEDSPSVIYSDAHARFALFRFRPGEELPRHRSRFPVVIQIVEGEVEISCGDERIAARPGMWIRLPTDLEHSVRTTGGARMLLQVCKQV